jgi:hypothetical protein
VNRVGANRQLRIILSPSRSLSLSATVRLGLVVWVAIGACPRARAESVADGGHPPALGPLEQESLDDALAGRGLAIDPAPQGKLIGRVHIVSQDVFSLRDGRLRWLNHLHRTTRAPVLARELLLDLGQPWDDALVEESTRRIQSPAPFIIAGQQLYQPELSSVVAIVPVVSRTPGRVDLLLVTRDVWSLRTNATFEFQQDALTLFGASLSENNLFGWRKHASLGFGFDQGAYNYGPTYVDPNVRGTRLTLWAAATLYASRETGAQEGDDELVSLHYPLYSLASRWGAGIDVLHQSVVPRVFRGNSLRLVDLAATPNAESIPYAYRRRSVTVDANVVRSFGKAVLQRATVGYFVDGRRSEALPDFPGDAATARLFLAEWAPNEEQRSGPYVGYEAFTPRYVVLRNLGTFDLREHRHVGFSFRVRLTEGLPALGADVHASGLSVIAGGGFSPAGGYLSLTAGASARFLHGDGRLVDQAAGLAAYAVTPLIDGILRIVATLEVGSKRADTAHTPFVLGGAMAPRGYHLGELHGPAAMRGYQIGEFLGTTAFAGHLELRTAALAVGSQRVGMTAFYDVGHAARSLADLVPHDDVGLGIRWLIPQLGSSVVRVDWAVALQDGPLTRVGMPGRFTAGFQQVF